jgi:hypothetical protein
VGFSAGNLITGELSPDVVIYKVSNRYGLFALTIASLID